MQPNLSSTMSADYIPKMNKASNNAFLLLLLVCYCYVEVLPLSFSPNSPSHQNTPLEGSKMIAKLNIRGGVDFQSPQRRARKSERSGSNGFDFFQNSVYGYGGNGNHYNEDRDNFRISSTNAKLYWFPRKSRGHQLVRDLKISHFPSDESIMDCHINRIPGNEHLELDWDWDRASHNNGGGENVPRSSSSNSALFEIEAIVETKKDIIPIRHKIPFPFEFESNQYHSKEHAEMILDCLGLHDMNDERQGRKEEEDRITDHFHPSIEDLADELIHTEGGQQKKDYFEVVHTIADWVSSNIEYSFSPSNGKSSTRTASQVLKSQAGKCDEMTALFVALLRAAGIPCRFVSGYAYTNKKEVIQYYSNVDKTRKNDQGDWGPHSWAEVYFPSYSAYTYPAENDSAGLWIPFDVTYQQFGYVGCSHVVLNKSHNAEKLRLDVEFSAFAKGGNFALATREIETEIIPIDMMFREDEEDEQVEEQMNMGGFQRERTDYTKSYQKNAIDVSLQAKDELVPFGSEVIISALLRNNCDYYVCTQLNVGKPKDIELIGIDGHDVSEHKRDTIQNVMLKPREVKEIEFVFLTDEQGYKPGMYYDHTFSMIASLSQCAEPENEELAFVRVHCEKENNYDINNRNSNNRNVGFQENENVRNNNNMGMGGFVAPY